MPAMFGAAAADGASLSQFLPATGNPLLRTAVSATDELLKNAAAAAGALGQVSGAPAPANKFIFRSRTGRLNWRLLHSLDLDRVVRDGDVETIQAHLDNITFARFSKEDLEATNDESLIKMVQLSQLSMEFLSSMCSTSLQLLQSLVDRVRVQAAQLKALDGRGTSRNRRDRRLREDGRRQASVPAGLSLLGAPARRCLYCPKRFLSEQYLIEHVHRRHAAEVLGAGQEAHRAPPPQPPPQLPAEPVVAQPAKEPVPPPAPQQPSIGEKEVVEAVKVATSGLVEQLKAVQREFNSSMAALRQDVSQCATDVVKVADDVGKLQQLPKAVVEQLPQLPLPPPPVVLDVPKFDQEVLQKNLERRVSGLIDANQQMLLAKIDAVSEKVSEVAKAAAKAPPLPPPPPAPTGVPAKEVQEHLQEQMAAFKKIQEDVQRQLQENANLVSKAAAEAAAKAIASELPKHSAPAPPPPPALPKAPAVADAAVVTSPQFTQELPKFVVEKPEQKAEPKAVPKPSPEPSPKATPREVPKAPEPVPPAKAPLPVPKEEGKPEEVLAKASPFAWPPKKQEASKESGKKEAALVKRALANGIAGFFNRCRFGPPALPGKTPTKDVPSLAAAVQLGPAGSPLPPIEGPRPLIPGPAQSPAMAASSTAPVTPPPAHPAPEAPGPALPQREEAVRTPTPQTASPSMSGQDTANKELPFGPGLPPQPKTGPLFSPGSALAAPGGGGPMAATFPAAAAGVQSLFTTAPAIPNPKPPGVPAATAVPVQAPPLPPPLPPPIPPALPPFPTGGFPTAAQATSAATSAATIPPVTQPLATAKTSPPVPAPLPPPAPPAAPAPPPPQAASAGASSSFTSQAPLPPPLPVAGAISPSFTASGQVTAFVGPPAMTQTLQSSLAGTTPLHLSRDLASGTATGSSEVTLSKPPSGGAFGASGGVSQALQAHLAELDDVESVDLQQSQSTTPARASTPVLGTVDLTAAAAAPAGALSPQAHTSSSFANETTQVRQWPASDAISMASVSDEGGSTWGPSKTPLQRPSPVMTAPQQLALPQPSSQQDEIKSFTPRSASSTDSIRAKPITKPPVGLTARPVPPAPVDDLMEESL